MSVEGRCDECEQDKPDATEGAHPLGGNGAVLCGDCRAKLITELGETDEEDEGWVYSLAEGRRWVLARLAEIHAKPSRQEGDTIHDLWNTTPLEIEHIDEVLAVLLDEGIIMQERPGFYTLA